MSSNNQEDDNCPSLLDTLGFLKFPQNTPIDFTDNTSTNASTITPKSFSQSGGTHQKKSSLNTKINLIESDSDDSSDSDSDSDNNSDNNSKNNSDSNSDNNSDSDTESDDTNSNSDSDSDNSDSDSGNSDTDSDNSDTDSECDSEESIISDSSKTNKLLSNLSLKNSKNIKKQEKRSIMYKHVL